MNRPLIVPLLLSTLFIFIFSSYSLIKHFSFNTHALDLGIFIQATYLYGQGELPFSSLKHMVILGDHFDPILLPLSFILKPFPTAETLLVFQAALVSLSLIPIYFIVLHKLKNFPLAFTLSLAYISAPSILRGIDFDFHPGTASLLPLSLILYGWYFKKPVIYWLSFLLGLTFKEDVTFYFFGLGLYEFITEKNIRLGSITCLAAALSFYLIKFKIMPFFWPTAAETYISTSSLPLTNPVDLLLLYLTKPLSIIDTFFNSPIKTANIDYIFRQFGFLSIFSPLSWFTVIPYLYLRFSSSLTYLWGYEFHNNATFTPFLAVAAAFYLEKFKSHKKLVVLFLLFFIMTGGLAPYGSFWLMFPFPTVNSKSVGYLYQALKQIPPQAKISAQNTIVPHVSNRKILYLFPEIADADYIILDTNLNTYPLSPENLHQKIDQLRNSKSYQIFLENKTLIVFKKTL